MKLILSKDLLHNYFDYSSGHLYWKIRSARCISVGQKAGSLKRDGYWGIALDKKLYLAHRFIFLWHHGYLPQFIDHIDGNKANNNIENLRPATASQNQQNRRAAKNSSSKYLGVRLAKGKYWRAQINFKGKQRSLGSFKTEVEAAKAYNECAKINFGEFANLNKV